ncbi:MAG: SCO family protein [Haloarculaceae archaeon]
MVRDDPSTGAQGGAEGAGEPRTRRRVLAASTAVLGGGLAGCVGHVLGGHGETHTYLDVHLNASASKYPYPAHGQRLPSMTLPAPLANESVTLTQYHDRDVVLSPFYSHCQGVCARVISAMRSMQTRAEKQGKSDRVQFLAITFDPKRDTPERLRKYADIMHVDLSIGNWRFLRPQTEKRAAEVVHGKFGYFFEKQWKTPTPTGTGHETTASTPAPSRTDTQTAGPDVITPDSEGKYGFTHPSMIELANQDAYVEKSYRDAYPVWQTIYDDLKTLWKREG